MALQTFCMGTLIGLQPER